MKYYIAAITFIIFVSMFYLGISYYKNIWPFHKKQNVSNNSLSLNKSKPNRASQLVGTPRKSCETRNCADFSTRGKGEYRPRCIELRSKETCEKACSPIHDCKDSSSDNTDWSGAFNDCLNRGNSKKIISSHGVRCKWDPNCDVLGAEGQDDGCCREETEKCSEDDPCKISKGDSDYDNYSEKELNDRCNPKYFREKQ